MVYRGKPSAACGECRKRRSRCDQTIPACGQCSKAGRKCPGYRNKMDLMFHDESTPMFDKNKSTPRVGTGKQSQANAQAVVASPVKLTDFVMYQPLDDLGVNFFMSNYVDDNPTVSQLYYLPTFYTKTGYMNAGLRQSITAAGLAGYAKTSRRKDIIDLSTKSYIAAVRGINHALSNPKTAAQDSTLMSIILAAMFEVLIIPRKSGMQNCSKHLDGAVSVANLHLKQEKQTTVTQKLFATLVQSVIMNSWIQHIPLPSGFVELRKQIGEQINPHSVHGTFLDIIMELVQFRHALHDGVYDSPMAIITKALSIDNSLSDFARNMPPHAQFRRCRISRKAAESLVYEGYYHIYPQRFTAHLWNNVRSSRLRLHQVILRESNVLLSSGHSDSYSFLEAQKLASEAKIIAFAKEIVASVPQLAGYMDQFATYQTHTEQALSAPIRFPAPRPGEPHLANHIPSASIELSPHLVYDPGPFHGYSPIAPTPNTSPASTPSPSLSHQPDPQADTAPPVPPPTFPSVPQPQPASLYHMLFQLYALRCVTCLPVELKSWIQDRIAWMERNADAQDLSRMQSVLRKRPGDGFPVSYDEAHNLFDTVAIDGNQRELWREAQSWFTFGYAQQVHSPTPLPVATEPASPKPWDDLPAAARLRLVPS